MVFKEGIFCILNQVLFYVMTFNGLSERIQRHTFLGLAQSLPLHIRVLSNYFRPSSGIKHLPSYLLDVYMPVQRCYMSLNRVLKPV